MIKVLSLLCQEVQQWHYDQLDSFLDTTHQYSDILTFHSCKKFEIEL